MDNSTYTNAIENNATTNGSAGPPQDEWTTYDTVSSTGYDVINRSFALGNWTQTIIGCSEWDNPHHLLFQLANCVLLMALLSPDSKHGVLFMHSSFVLGFLLLSIWSWVILCAPDYFSWNFCFMIVNALQTLFLMYHIRPVKFCDDLEEVYVGLFQPLTVSRQQFKKLVCPDYCTLSTLHEGETYASQGISKTDKLGLLISGRMNVFSHHSQLHQIQEREFIDSPEFESGVCGDERYQVSIVAASVCRYIFWPRQSLEYLLIKEPHLASIFNAMLGRDITNKLYALNEKIMSSSGSRMDIRLPSISSAVRVRQDYGKSLLSLPVDSQGQVHHTSDEDTLPDDEESTEETEQTELLNGHLRNTVFPGQRLSNCSGTPTGSRSSVHSGIRITV